MPKDPTRNQPNYKIGDAQLDEYEFQQGHAAISQEERQRHERYQEEHAQRGGEDGAPLAPQTEAERIQQVIATAHEKVEQRRRKRGHVGMVGVAENKGARKQTSAKPQQPAATAKTAVKAAVKAAKKGVKSAAAKTAVKATGKSVVKAAGKSGTEKSAGKQAATAKSVGGGVAGAVSRSLATKGASPKALTTKGARNKASAEQGGAVKRASGSQTAARKPARGR